MARFGQMIAHGAAQLFRGYCIGIGLALGLLSTVLGYAYLSALMGWQQ